MERYAAFISYSHADDAVARWLHRSIETYRFPKALIGSETAFGPLPRRLPPVFRDRDELPASGDLGADLRRALADARFQIVLCSPSAAASQWVNEEILAFKASHGEGRTLALILSGEPYAGDERECFPPALRFRLGSDGALSDVPTEPIAADIRPGKDGRRLALLKLLAGITGVRLDALVRRDAVRRQRRLTIITAISLGIALVTIGLAIYAEAQRRIAVRQRQLAERSLDFLVGTFEIANPATENPRTITALTILNRASRRAAMDFGNEPAVSARLLRTTGEIYSNLGLLKESERDLLEALALQPATSEERANILIKLAALEVLRTNPRAMAARLDQAGRAYSRNASYAPLLDAQLQRGYAMVAYLDGDYAKASKMFAKAVRQYEQLDGNYREEIGRVQMTEAQSLVYIRRFAEANRLFEQAVRNFTAKFGVNDVRTATAIQNQGWADFEAGRSALASQRIDRAVAIYDRVLEGDHPTIAAAMLLSGRIRTRTGDEKGALVAFDRARTIFTHLYGPDNAAVGDVDFYAAEAEAKAGQLDAALARLANTKRIYDMAYGPDDPDQAELLLQRARILGGAGQRAHAARNCADALALQVKLKSEAAVLADTRRTCAALQ
jgi:tetratricopeptide (TPR) repeat protein